MLGVIQWPRLKWRRLFKIITSLLLLASLSSTGGRTGYAETSPSPFDANGIGDISGIVELSLNGMAVPNAVVTLVSGGTTLTTTTDASGHYVFSSVPAGGAWILATDNSGNDGLVTATIQPNTSNQASAILLHPNLVLNPSFEQGTTLPTDWQPESPVGSIQAWETGTAHTGTHSVSLSGPTPIINGVQYDISWESTNRVSVRPGGTYAMSVWVFSSNTYNPSVSQYWMELEYFDANGNSLSGPAGIQFTLSPTPTNYWQLALGCTTVPANVASVQPRLNFMGPSISDQNKIYFDDVAFWSTCGDYRVFLPMVAR